MNIRTRIITAFLSLLIVPLLVVILGLVLINTNIIPIPGYESLSELSDDVDTINTYFNDHVPSEKDGWKIQIDDLGQMVVDLLKLDPRTLPSKIEVRPSQPPK